MGMKQRLGIARAILCKPELILLDEPTNGLDPAGMKQIRDLFRMLSAEYGMTLMISSHLLSEIESIADTIGIIHHGWLRKEISMAEIDQMNFAYIEAKVSNTKQAAFVLSDKMETQNFKIADKGEIRIYDSKISIPELAKTFALNDVEVLHLGKKTETLEDYFLKMTAEVEK